MERLADELPLSEVRKRCIVASDAQSAMASIRPNLEADNHSVFHAPGHDQSRFFREFAEGVLPSLRVERP